MRLFFGFRCAKNASRACAASARSRSSVILHLGNYPVRKTHVLRPDGHYSGRRREWITSVQSPLCDPGNQNDEEDAKSPESHTSSAHRFLPFVFQSKSYTTSYTGLFFTQRVARPARIELAAPRLGGGCSIP